MSRKLIALAALALGACSPGYSYRYRVTVEVNTPQGVKSGSSVWETTQWEGSGIPDTAIRSKVSGEAIALDLPGGTLFALMRGTDMNVDYATNIVYRHLALHPQPDVSMIDRSDSWSKNMSAIARSRAAFELYPDEYPLLVHFRDLHDPASVEKLDPTDLAASFGPGVRLKSITIAVTNDRVTTGNLKRLPWLTGDKGALVQIPPDMPMNQAPFAAHVLEQDFVMRGL